MVREGTRSQTGNSKPRVFAVVDTEPTIKRTVKRKPAAKKEAATKTAVKGAKPTGVVKTKFKKPPVKIETVTRKPIRPDVNLKTTTKPVDKAEKPKKEAKPKTTTKKKEAAAAK